MYCVSAHCVLCVPRASLNEEQSEVLAYTIYLEAHANEGEASVTKVYHVLRPLPSKLFAQTTDSLFSPQHCCKEERR